MFTWDLISPLRALAAVLLCSSALLATANDGLPLVTEHYDAVMLVHEDQEDRQWSVTRAYFVRESRVVADRAVHDEMHWSQTRDHKFCLAWDDYGQCRRMVTFDNLIEFTAAKGSTSDGGHHAWWCMGRRMTDLKAVNEP